MSNMNRLLILIVAFAMSRSTMGQSPQEWIDLQVPQAIKIRDSYLGDEAGKSKRTLHLVYWTPKDREPIVGYRERLSRVLFDIQDFYRKEMSRLGFGAMTFDLDTEADGLLKIHVVRGKEPYAKYNVESGYQIRNETLPVLASAGIDANKETIVLFCNMSNWDPKNKTMTQNSPYYATGGLRNGTAWQVDSQLLDANSLSDKEPIIQDGQYGRISVGKYNSIFVGGVCHELGHALGLPHDMERPDEGLSFGTSLMGSGNRTYGDDRRGEGRGSFLTLADGLRLASHPLFTQSEKGIDLKANARISHVSVELAKDRKSFQFTGRVQATPAAYAVVGYIDPNGGSDYDATTVTSIPDSDGNFSLQCATFQSGKGTILRIVVCQSNGGRIDDQVLQVPMIVDTEGKVDLSSYLSTLQLTEMVTAIREKDSEKIAVELAKIDEKSKRGEADPLLREVAHSLAGSFMLQVGPSPEKEERSVCWLSDAQSKQAKVGWLRPTVNRLPNESVLIMISGRLFARGLYAHAPSNYTYELGSRWKVLKGFAGIADGHSGGSVEFVVVGDGKELWRSKKSSEGKLHEFQISMEGIREVSFVVEDGGDGNGSDWGVWADLQVTR